MAKIGRNSPCPCGSGRKYKKCHGDPLNGQHVGGPQRSTALPPELDLALARHQARELIRTQQQGLGKPIIADTVGDHQVVAVGDTIHYSIKWKYFPDFLSDYLKTVLSSEWGNSEIAKPLEERHPVMQWYNSYCEFQRIQERKADGSFTAEATGVVVCYLGLAYNLYLLKHNVELQDKLIARIKNREQFQGAYYELMIANCLIRAGFELTLEDESDNSSKHCEFSAVSKQTGKTYWVEVKMRSVSGFLGKTDADGATLTSKPTSRLSKHLKNALSKPAADERLIFLDVNAAPMEHQKDSSGEFIRPKWIEAAGRILDDCEKDLKEGHETYVFVTNMSFHRALDKKAHLDAAMIHGLGIADFAKAGQIRVSEAWKQKQKHIDAYHILAAIKLYPKIPNSFDGGLALNESTKESHVQIGNRYYFDSIGDNGMLGEITEAIISEPEKKMYIGVTSEDGKGHILTKDVTDEELIAYKEHPDAFFGVVRPVGKGLEGPYELFEWLVDCHKDMPKEKLLEFCKDHPDAESLALLDQKELMLEVCERWTASIIARQTSKAGTTKVGAAQAKAAPS